MDTFENQNTSPEEMPQETPQPQTEYRGTGTGRREETGSDQATYTAYHTPPQNGGYQPPYYQVPYYQGYYQGGSAPQPKPPKKRSGGRVARRVLAAVLALVVLAGCCTATAYLTSRYWMSQDSANLKLYIDQRVNAVLSGTDSGSSSGSTTNVVVTVNGLSSSEIYEKNIGSVVAVTCTISSGRGQTYGTSAGTGFIISEDGFIVTNYHVVEDAVSVHVTLSDGTEYTCEVRGYDETNDVAVLKAEDATGLKPVTIGSSSALKVGDPVVAIGNALGELSFSLTGGYVSGIDREITTDGTVLNMIQTDAAINSGNSGGPLFNSQGEVVGITTAKYSGTTSSGASIEGISFAIPLDDVIGIISDLRDYGYVTGAYLGISVSDVDSSAQAYGVPAGAHVREVVKGFCAAEAGLQAGDIIIEVGGYDVTGVNSLSRALRNFKAGDTAAVTVWRSGQRIVLSVTFNEKPQS